MYIEINKYEFSDLFDKYNRSNNFTREARELLYDFFEDMGNDTSEPVDIIAICCDFNEDSLQDIIDNYRIEIDPEEDTLEQVQDYLQYKTIIVGLTEGDKIVYQVF